LWSGDAFLSEPGFAGLEDLWDLVAAMPAIFFKNISLNCVGAFCLNRDLEDPGIYRIRLRLLYFLAESNYSDSCIRIIVLITWPLYAFWGHFTLRPQDGRCLLQRSDDHNLSLKIEDGKDAEKTRPQLFHFIKPAFARIKNALIPIYGLTSYLNACLFHL
jgi:hypothetical protein